MLPVISVNDYKIYQSLGGTSAIDQTHLFSPILLYSGRDLQPFVPNIERENVTKTNLAT